jgi:hypothetical protein
MNVEEQIDFLPLRNYFPPELVGIPCGLPQPMPGEVGRYRGQPVVELTTPSRP